MPSTESTREEISRLSADTPQDWERVKGNVMQAMKQILARKLAADPKIAHTKDAVTAHLEAWLYQIFESSKPNLRVNGHNLETYDPFGEEGMEPFDETLDRRIWTLNAERIGWDNTLADYRRQTPLQVERLMADLIEQQHPVQCVESEEEDAEMDEELPEMERREEVVATHLATLEIVEDLQKTVPALVAKSDRAKEVAAEISSLAP